MNAAAGQANLARVIAQVSRTLDENDAVGRGSKNTDYDGGRAKHPFRILVRGKGCLHALRIGRA